MSPTAQDKLDTEQTLITKLPAKHYSRTTAGPTAGECQYSFSFKIPAETASLLAGIANTPDECADVNAA